MSASPAKTRGERVSAAAETAARRNGFLINIIGGNYGHGEGGLPNLFLVFSTPPLPHFRRDEKRVVEQEIREATEETVASLWRDKELAGMLVENTLICLY